MSSSYHPVTNSVSVESFWTPSFRSFVGRRQAGPLSELACEHLFFFQKNSCFSSSFIGIENTFAAARIIFANVIDIKRMHSIANTAWISLKRLRAFIYPDYTSPICKKVKICDFLSKFFFQKKGIVAKLLLYFAGWMITNSSGNTTVKQRIFQFPQKEKLFPSLLVGNNDFFRNYVF